MTFISYLKQSNKHFSLSTTSALAFGLLALLSLGMTYFDDRELLGINIWIKPTKFWLSSAIFMIVLPYYFKLISPEKTQILQRTFVFVLWLENILISVQAARGQQSHFNTEDPLGIAIFSIMGLAITISTLAIAMLLYRLYQNRMRMSALQFQLLSWGIVLTLAGSIGGGIMSGIMKHTIGAADGGPGIPFMNWSTVAGDLRIMHFVGLHAFQFFPLLIILSQKTSAPTVIKSLAIIYTLIFGFTTIQALLGLPLFSA